MSKPQHLAPADIDAKLANFLENETIINNLIEAHKQDAEEILQLVKRNGQPLAEKSRVLIGELYEAVRTDGHSTKVIAVECDKLRVLMAHAGMLPMFKQLFVKESRYVLAPRYAEKRIEIEERVTFTAKVRRAFKNAVSVEPQTPKLKVRARKQDSKKTEAAA